MFVTIKPYVVALHLGVLNKVTVRRKSQGDT